MDPRTLFRGAAVVLCVASVWVTGCADTLRMAVGSTRDAGLTTPFPLDDPRVGALVGILQEEVQMVRPEPRFEIHPFESSLFRGNRDWKAIVLLLNAAEPGPLGRDLRMLLSAEEIDTLAAQEAGFRVVRDVWATGQAVLLVHTRQHPEAFFDYLVRERESIVEAFEQGLQVALQSGVLATGEQVEMMRYIERNYGFRVRIPRDWVAAEDARGRTVRIYRVIDGQPPRFLMIHWMPADEAPRTGEELLALRDRLGAEYYDGDRVLAERSWTEPATFQGEPAVLLAGVYQNYKYAFGGPFRAYAFTRGDRFYLVDAAVYNPQPPPEGRKMPYIRETLALARTFEPVAAP